MSSKARIIDEIIEFMHPGAMTLLSEFVPEIDEVDRAYKRVQAEVNNNKAMLEAMNEEDLARFYLSRQSLDLQKRIEEERLSGAEAFFFHHESAAANFSSWLEIRHWNLEQATALLLGKDPTVVNSASMASFAGTSYFARKFLQLRADLEAADLVFPAYPEEVVHWAERQNRDVSQALVELVRATARNVSKQRQARASEQSKEKVSQAAVTEDTVGTGEGGTKLRAVTTLLNDLFGPTRPTGQTKKTIFTKVQDQLRVKGMDQISQSTFDRAWKQFPGS